MTIARLSHTLLLVVLLTALIAAMQPAVPAAAATARVTGTVVCASGRDVVGVWIESSAGGSGWASFARMAGRSNVATYSRSITFNGSSTRLHPTVGCGGTPQRWASSNPAPAVTVSRGYVYNVRCNDPAGGTGRCSGAPNPTGRSTNWFAGGYCTWGAAELWKKATGQYPPWSGNAIDWGRNAKAAGFRVTVVPHAQSVVVFEQGYGSLGHVAWVTGVRRSENRTIITIREMNYRGLWNWSNRDVVVGRGVTFIVARPGHRVTS